MTDASTLIKNIRNEFGSIPFPLHCGLHAAVAKDDWIDDEKELRRITESSDHIGEWWDVPLEHLLKCMKALSYLDSAGIEFYLPAYMVAALEHPAEFDKADVFSRSWQIISIFTPANDDPELQAHFYGRFSRIADGKKSVCRNFLKHVAERGNYDPHAKELASEALANRYWVMDS